MKSRTKYFAVVTILLVLIASFLIRRMLSSPIDYQKSDVILGNGMPPDLMTSQRSSFGEYKELMAMVEKTIQDEWISNGSKHKVKNGDLVEVDETSGDYTLTMKMYWRDEELATAHRYFVSYPGPDTEIDDRPLTILACAMSTNGFFSGSCNCTEVSRTEVAISPDFEFDNRDTKVVSKFNRAFNATLGGAGTVECGNEAALKWQLEKKVMEQ